MSHDAYRGRNVLIVEDEMLIAAQMEETLTDLGCKTSAAGRLNDALRLATSRKFDAAFLDLNLEGEASLPVADLLAESGIPFALMTGYTSPRVRTRYPQAAVLSKPFNQHEVLQTLANLLQTEANGSETGSGDMRRLVRH